MVKMPADTNVSLRNRLLIVLLFLSALGALCLRDFLKHIRPVIHKLNGSWTQVFDWKIYSIIAALLAVIFSTVTLLLPYFAQRFEARLTLRRSSTVLLLGALSLTMCGLILYLTNQQYGAFDESVIVDTFWRQASGQIAYRDFITTNCPLFVLGLRAATIFGNDWMAQAWILCCFSCFTFFWTYWLLRSLKLGRAKALLLSLLGQTCGVVLLSFWWYNSITAVSSGIYLLSCLLLLKDEHARKSQVNFCAALVLLSWTKPNAAGLFGLISLLILLIGVRNRIRLLAMAALSLTLSVAMLVPLVSVRAILLNYAGVAKSRALAFLAFKINAYYTAEAYFQFACLSAALLLIVPALWRGLTERNGRQISYNLLLLAGSLIGVFVLASNGDIVDVGLPPVLLSAGVAVFASKKKNAVLNLFFVAFYCAIIGTQLYKADIRIRTYLIGPYYSEHKVAIHNNFFHGMHTGEEMNAISTDIQSVLNDHPGEVFFTSRLEWAYAAFRLESPRNLPLYWHPGTSYSLDSEAEYVKRWEDRRFDTVVQPPKLKTGTDDWIAFPDALRTYIQSHYRKDGHYRRVVVWRRLPV